MASRGRCTGADWGSIRSGCDTPTGLNDDEERDSCRLLVTCIPKALNEEGLRAAFANYGTLTEVYLSSDSANRYGLVKFETQGEAMIAMMKLNHTEPLKFNISIAHKKPGGQHPHPRRNKPSSKKLEKVGQKQLDSSSREQDFYNDSVSITSSRRLAKVAMFTTINGDADTFEPDDMAQLDPDLGLQLERLRLQTAQLLYKQRLRDAATGERRMEGHSVQPSDRSSYGAAGDSKRAPMCSRETSGASTPSTCVCCSSKPSESTKQHHPGRRPTRDDTISVQEFKYSDLFYSSEEPDETDRLIKLRSADYLDIVDDDLKMVIALSTYPKSKIRLQQIELFKKSLADVMDMQLKAGLLKKTPVFLDYYLNRGAIVCICKDMDTRDWMVRISQGLQERMNTELVFFKTNVKRLCLAMLKIPEATWPATAQDAFKLLQYFNPTLKTDLWKIYAQKTVDDVECTSIILDKVSGEIIRGPSFKNVIDYKQMEFELSGYIEIYYECFLNEIDDDIRSVASRVKLLDEIRSTENTPRNDSEINATRDVKLSEDTPKSEEEDSTTSKVVVSSDCGNQNDTVIIEEPDNDIKHEFEMSLQKEVLKKLKDVQQCSDKEVIVWSGNTTNDSEEENDAPNDVSKFVENIEDNNMASISIVAVSDKTDSVTESSDNLLPKSSNVNIDSSRGIAYHRRTNYLHVENELKIAITLDGYPQNKLEGTHIRRLKHLFKDYLNKDVKQQKFANLIIPKFHDVYLSNGAVIYICDSLETKDYLAEVLPKFVHSTGLKLAFRDIKNLVRYTRIVMRLPQEFANVESIDILKQLKAEYPDLKPDCWKYYSDVAGKQKRQFGVDPISLDVIKSPNFNPMYKGEELTFRIIDRQKRDVSYEDTSRKDENEDTEEGRKIMQKVLKLMYCPINPDITNAPLTRIRTNHYSDLIADDLKMYVGPPNYPETTVDEHLFHVVKRSFESILCEATDKGDVTEESMPSFHDMYLFDGVIFIICANFVSRHWIEHVLPSVSARIHTPLRSTEFRGAVGIVSMYAATTKNTDEVVEVLQKQNPRLRTKYWREISTVKTKTKLDVVLQIDKLSAQVISDHSFNSKVGHNEVHFKLGHLKSLIKPNQSLEELTKSYYAREFSSSQKSSKTAHKAIQPKMATTKSFTIKLPSHTSYKEVTESLKRSHPNIKTELWSIVGAKDNLIEVEIDRSSAKQIKKQKYRINDVIFTKNKVNCGDTSAMGPTSPRSDVIPTKIDSQTCHVTLKMPQTISGNSDDLQVIFDQLEDSNPGLNTELWDLIDVKEHGNNEMFHMTIDKQSATIIQGKKFNGNVGGQKIRFLFD